MACFAGPARAADVAPLIGTNLVGGRGLQPNTDVQVTVVREGVVIASASDVRVAADGTFAINAPGSRCFSPITPRLRAGDTVHVVGADGEVVVSVHDLEVRRIEAGPGATQVTVDARARDHAGQPLVGARVRLWADGAFQEGVVQEHRPGELTAVFTFASPEIAQDAVDGGIAEVVWTDPLDPSAVTVGQVPGTPFAAPGCPPFAELAVSAVSPPIIGIADAPAVAISGTAPPDAELRVAILDAAGGSVGPLTATSSSGGAWSIGDVDVSTLQSGALQITVEAAASSGGPWDSGVPGVAVLDLVRPSLDALVLNHGMGITRAVTVPLEISTSDAAPGSGLFVAVADTVAGLDAATRVPLGSVSSTTFDGEGRRAVCVRVFDGAGNVAPHDLCAQVVVDRTPPAFSGHTPPPNATVSGPASPSVAVTDANGLDRSAFAARIDGVPVSGTFLDGRITLPPVGPGAHTVTLGARDLAGNEAQTSWSFVVTPPDAPPTVEVKLPRGTGGYWYGARLPIQVRARDDRGITRLEVYAGTSLLARTRRDRLTFTWRPSRPGRQSLIVFATDTAGQQTRHEVSTFICDPHMDYCAPPRLPSDGTPYVELLTPTSRTRVRRYNTYELNAIADGASPIEQITFRVNGVAIRTDPKSPYQAWWQPRRAGEYILEATATDAQGRSRSHLVRVQVR